MDAPVRNQRSHLWCGKNEPKDEIEGARNENEQMETYSIYKKDTCSHMLTGIRPDS